MVGGEEWRVNTVDRRVRVLLFSITTLERGVRPTENPLV